MSWAVSIFRHMLDWRVERKVTLLLLLSVVAVPLVLLVMLHSQGAQATMNFLVGLLTASIILFVPLSKWMSHVIALRNIREINDQCTQIKQGDYANVELPLNDFDGSGHDFVRLKRNMYWMGHAIATREKRLQSAMTRLAASQRQIGESLDYARLIQTSFLPDAAKLDDLLPGHFLIWSQRDAVGGDSYWFRKWGGGFFVGVMDCTGHGVPGAFMTLIVHSLLEKAVAEADGSPAAVLGSMNRLIKKALRQNRKDAVSDDGMDCALCYVNPDAGRLTFAGARNSLFRVDADGVEVIKGDRCGLGYVRSPEDYRFSDTSIHLTGKQRFYMATDGLSDQVGGEKRLPFGKRRFMRFVNDGFRTPMNVQREELLHLFEEYQGGETRRDDVTVLGFELG
ncbi:PP2C family protein-serine/threonine phosphatase [Pseudodesulfovibrio senegalensis]|uniref:SpoIIE family protein phosphatase n=1 Tax=Pseudodesulfovibrio senegalensis TaxID=1721087 RepID=A0A6N6N3N8_9BACT|nr:PP2C family protein-serine/threonine phosphatase [Pseudodesulfovibrio senegalensis]KAB1442187.1 SpoIIE family protein phosphatase [Pseudodesulfovibrio senegalensis]